MENAFLIVIVLFAVLVSCWIIFGDHISIDACLDRGGRWNDADEECEYERSGSLEFYLDHQTQQGISKGVQSNE